MPRTSRLRAFVDADVLASPVPRTLLYLARPLSDYELVYSPHVEAEATRHQKTGHVPVADLRRRFDWTLVQNAPTGLAMEDTDPKDRPILADAVAAGAVFVVTRNVRHFGVPDLARYEIGAVHPGLFLAHHITAAVYHEVLDAVAANRQRAPRDPRTIHETEVASELPALFDAHRELFGPAGLSAVHAPPSVVIKGPRCIRCAQLTATDPAGLCPQCAVPHPDP
ncbi:MAG: hypothetical protein LBK72_11365 [Bifidobacteriaceae bacterium]|nr:hypothetical protein [Bifidobacteriaceae bacterium]